MASCGAPARVLDRSDFVTAGAHYYHVTFAAVTVSKCLFEGDMPLKPPQCVVSMMLLIIDVWGHHVSCLAICSQTEGVDVWVAGLQVSLTRIYKLSSWADLKTAIELDADRSLLEVTANCEDGQQPTAGAAIGSLAQLLLPFVELRKS